MKGNETIKKIKNNLAPYQGRTLARQRMPRTLAKGIVNINK